MAEPDQGWESWLNQVRQHQPNTPIPPDAPTGTPSDPPPGSGPADSAPIHVTNVSAAAAPDVQAVAAPAVVAAAAAAPAFTPPPASFADNAIPLVVAPMAAAPLAAPAAVSDSAGARPLAGMPTGGSAVSDSGAVIGSLAQYAAFGWHIVPSIGNDPTYADGSTGDGSLEWGFADAGYASDWFFFA